MKHTTAGAAMIGMGTGRKSQRTIAMLTKRKK
jgi:hypothetical protein